MAPLNLVRLAAGRATRPISFQTQICLRKLHQSSLLSFPRKDSQDKDSINTEATEYSKSGSDDAAAANSDAAFDPSQTSPGKEKSTAGEGNEVGSSYADRRAKGEIQRMLTVNDKQETGNPLEVSPANTEVSKERPQQEGGAQNSSAERKQSGHGSPKKEGKV